MKMNSLKYLIPRGSLINAYHYAKTYGVRNLADRTLAMMLAAFRYNNYVRSHRLSSQELASQSEESFPFQPLISIIVPTYNTPHDYLTDMIESVTAQSYSRWELCIADGSPDHAPIESVVREYQKRYPSIRFRALNENLGIAGNTNAALALATGDYIALLDHDDFLTPDALYEVVRALNRQGAADVVYTDEDKYDSAKKRYYDPNFKPDFDQDYLLCCNYITHFYVVKKTIVDEIGGFSTTMDGSQDYDFILRTTEKAAAVLHIPKVLYHWRIHSNSVAGDPTSKMYAYDAAQNALNSHYKRFGIDAEAEKTENLGFYRTHYALQGDPLVSVIMKNCDRSLKEQILSITDYKRIEFVSRWSDVRGDYVLFLDQVSRIPLEPTWLTDLVSNCQRPGIGAVSGKVLSSEDRFYEYGLIYDQKGVVLSPFYNYPTAYPTYYHLTDSQHSISLAGGHCLLAARRDIRRFIRANHPKKLDQAFAYELCMWLQNNNQRVIILPYIDVILNTAPQPSFMFYQFEKIPQYILDHPYDPMYNQSLSVTRPYLI